MIEARKTAAKERKMFYESAPCKVCAKAKRYVSTGKCVECTQARSRAFHVETMRELRAARETP